MCKEGYKYFRDLCRPNGEHSIIRSSNWMISDVILKGGGIELQPSAVIIDEGECFNDNYEAICKKESITDFFLARNAKRLVRLSRFRNDKLRNLLSNKTLAPRKEK